MNRIVIVLLCVLARIWAEAGSGSVKYLSHEVKEANIVFHYDLNLNRMKGRKVVLNLYVESPKGKPLKNAGGYDAGAHQEVTPPYDGTHWSNYFINVRKNQFVRSKTGNYYICLQVSDEDGKLIVENYCGPFSEASLLGSGSKNSSGGSASSSSGRRSGGGSTSGAEGEWQECKVCLGKGTKVCMACGGTGSSLCYLCRGRGILPGNVVCGQCGGKGRRQCATIVECNICKGKGRLFVRKNAAGSSAGYGSSSGGYTTPRSNYKQEQLPCSGCNGSRQCRSCQGQGKVKRYSPLVDMHVLENCVACNGTGTCQVCHGTGHR